MTRDVQIAKAIRDAIKNGDRAALLALLGSDKSRLEMTTPFGSWLHVAASQNQLEFVKLLVSLGMDVNRTGGILGGTPLNEAASNGNLEIVRFLLSKGAVMDISDPRSNPLFGAIHGGHTEVAKLLIDSGIDFRVKYNGENMKDMDALAFAREWGRADIVNVLLEKEKGCNEEK